MVMTELRVGAGASAAVFHAVNDNDPVADEIRVFVTGYPYPHLWEKQEDAVAFLLDRAVQCVRGGLVPPMIAASRMSVERCRGYRSQMSFEDLDEIIAGRGIEPALWIEVPHQWMAGAAAVALPPEAAALDDRGLRELLRRRVRSIG